MMQNAITIVTVTYNSTDNIISLLKSIDISENKKLVKEVIVVENNSAQKVKTVGVVKNYIRHSKLAIKLVVKNNNDGFARSCNYGARLATTKYVLFINPDTTLRENSLSTLYNHAEQHAADIIGGISEKNSSNVHNTVVRHPNLFIGLFELTNLGRIFGINKGHSDFYYEDIKNLYYSKKDIKVDAIGGAYLMVKKLSFIALDGFDTNFFMYLEDVDLGVRANKKKLRVIFCPHSKISHIGGASSDNKQKIRHQAWFDSRKYYFKKHYGFWVNIMIQPFFIIEEHLLKIRQFIIRRIWYSTQV